MNLNQILKQHTLLVFIATFYFGCASTKSAPPPKDLGAKYKTVQEAAAQTKSFSQNIEKPKPEVFQPNAVNKATEAPFATSPAASNIPPPQSVDDLPVYGSWLDRLTGRVLDVESIVEAGANQNFPIVLNLVFVKDPETYTNLTTITTRNWFRRDEKEIEALKKQKDLVEIREITVLPERKTYSHLVRAPSHAKAGLLFVRLIGNDNLYPTLFNPYENLYLQFSSNNFTLKQETEAE